MGVKGFIEFIVAYMKVNIQAAMEYRSSFIIRAVGMFLNDAVWIIFWAIIFLKFQSINGWSFNEILLLFSFITTGFGFATFFFGNWQKIADVIINGKLDYYLTLPKPILAHLLVSRSEISGLGDFAFGVILALFVLPHTLYAVGLYILLTIMSMIILVSVGVAIGSLTFFIGGTGDLQDTIINSVIAISTYPFSIFEGYLRIILLTAVPIGFLTGIPVEILQSFNPTLIFYMVIATIAAVIAAITIFKIGLRRYESGNLINVQV
ncbi:MAG: ABC-2 family transporter protein [Candidatus Micrarchaeaceae archaeon]|jgi:ABC-2 type transport system permease protein